MYYIEWPWRLSQRKKGVSNELVVLYSFPGFMDVVQPLFAPGFLFLLY